MNALVRKEIRLIAPGWIVAVLLALTPICTRSDDGIPVFLLFMGLVMMALSPIGRETSLNTFSSLLAQPIDRERLWKIKISALSIAFLTVFVVWRIAIIFSFKDYGGRPADLEDSEGVVISSTLIFVSTFASGLWATLLLRQLAGAFWLTLLTPAMLAGFTTILFAENHSGQFISVVLCLVLGIYSLSGLFFARWLFFRAQDIGWTGGIISLPDWKIFSSTAALASTVRRRKPVFALLKKEFQLQQVPLMGAVGLLLLHICVIAWRLNHVFAKDSAGAVLTSIFWILWLVLPVMIGGIAVAEERRLGVAESQLCLPVSPRTHFAIKIMVAAFLGVLLGGVLPMLLESAALAMSGQTFAFLDPGDSKFFFWFQLSVIWFSACLALVSLFGSSLAKNFLQAIGFAIATLIGYTTLLSTFMNGRMFFFDPIPAQSILSIFIAVPVLTITFIWLAYLNYKNLLAGWPLWRRNLLGFIIAIVFITTGSHAIHNRVWETFEPAEPAHGAPIFSLAHAPRLVDATQVQLRDGRVWVCPLFSSGTYENAKTPLDYFHYLFANPFPYSRGIQGFITGSNWSSVIARYTYVPGGKDFLVGIGIHRDGTLWLSTNSTTGKHLAGEKCLDDQPVWYQITYSPVGLIFLKKDGTLWRWEGYENSSFFLCQTLAVRDLIPIEPDSTWKELSPTYPGYARKSDNSVWSFNETKIKGQETLQAWPMGDMDQVPLTTLSHGGRGLSYINSNGAVVIAQPRRMASQETNWQAVGVSESNITALKSDGSLWQWSFQNSKLEQWNGFLPNRLGIHSDWVAITTEWNGIYALAADGTLWYWPDYGAYRYSMPLKLPKQPKKIANLFDSH